MGNIHQIYRFCPRCNRYTPHIAYDCQECLRKPKEVGTDYKPEKVSTDNKPKAGTDNKPKEVGAGNKPKKAGAYNIRTNYLPTFTSHRAIIRASDSVAEAEVPPSLQKTVSEDTARPQLDRILEAVVELRSSWALEVAIYLAAIIAAEMVTVYVQLLGGIIAHVVILVAVIIRSAQIADKPQRQLVLSLALVPLIRIISLSMPLIGIPQMWWYPAMYGPLAVSAVVVMRDLGLSRKEVGFSFSVKMIPFYVAMAAAGFGLGMVEYHILKPEAWISQLSWVEVWQPALILMVTTGFVEELIFRGVLQRTAWEKFGWRGLIYVSILFAILHIGFLSWLDVAFVFGVAMFLAWAAKRTGSLLGVTLAHGFTNISLFLIAPFLF